MIRVVVLAALATWSGVAGAQTEAGPWPAPLPENAEAPPGAPPAPMRLKPAPTRITWGPFVGAHSYRGDLSRNFGTGPRFGALGGVSLQPWLSIGAEVSIDIANVRNLFLPRRFGG